MGNNKPGILKFSLFWGTVAFFTAVFFTFFSEIVLPKLQFLILSFLFLLLIIIIGIVFDMIGVAVAVAHEKPLHAKAAKKLKGAAHSIWIVRHADKVATFCNDVVGDICGTVSGALGAAIIFQIVAGKVYLNKYESILSMVMTGFVAAVTVGGKAAGKRTAMHDSDQIVYAVGRALSWIEDVTGINLLVFRSKSREKRR